METAGDHYTWNDEKLNDRLAVLSENRIRVEYTGPRLAQVSREIAMVAFELSERERERRGLTIEEAWSPDGKNGGIRQMKLFKKLDDGSFEEVTVAKVFETQDEMDTFIADKTSQIKRSQFGDYDDLKTKVSDLNKTVETLNSEKKTVEEQLQAKADEIAAEKLNTVRVKIKHENGLPDELDKFLIGDTEDDIRANAELLKKGGAAAGVTITKNNDDDGPKESASKKLAGNLFRPAGE